MLAFGTAHIDDRLTDHGLDGAGLHEIAGPTASLSNDAAATLFIAGIAARFAIRRGFTTLWALARFDLYAQGRSEADGPCHLRDDFAYGRMTISPGSGPPQVFVKMSGLMA